MREWLQALPGLGRDLPGFDPDGAPTDPATLFIDWLTDAAGAGVSMPHAGVLSTADPGGGVGARTIILKDVDEGRWVFATHPSSPKGQHLAANPRAALTYFWGARGRQVRVQGSAERLPPEVGTEDFLARSPQSRAAALTGHQSEPLNSLEAYHRAFAESLERVQTDPGLVARDWAAYALTPDWVEFWQATTDRGQIRLRYTRSEERWDRGLRWP